MSLQETRPPCVLIGDVGGTNALLELLVERDGVMCGVQELLLPSGAYASFELLLDDFFARTGVAAQSVTAACFSLAGPVEAGVCSMTNLAWRIDATALSARFRIPEVHLLNDFAAVGYGIARLAAHDLLSLQRGAAQPQGTRLVVGAGTGLGVCMLNWQGNAYAVHASEAGHADFAPLDATQDALLAALREPFGRMSYERIVSGPGLLRIFSFLQDHGGVMPTPALRQAMQQQDEAAAISGFAMTRQDPLAVAALDLFVSVYGAFAGNLALATLARGGVYIAGGIARKIATRMNDGAFMRAFVEKGRFADLLRRYPVQLVTDPKVGLKGALNYLQRQG